jgi:hypothetical protein
MQLNLEDLPISFAKDISLITYEESLVLSNVVDPVLGQHGSSFAEKQVLNGRFSLIFQYVL